MNTIWSRPQLLLPEPTLNPKLTLQGAPPPPRPTLQVDVLRRGPQRREHVLGQRVSDGQEGEDAAARVVDQHHGEGGPRLACREVGRWVGGGGR